MNPEIQKEIDSKVEALRKELTEKFSGQKLELIPGRWYWGKGEAGCFLVRFEKEHENVAYGDYIGGNYFNFGDPVSASCDLFMLKRLATHEEIKSALINVAELKGFKEGVEFSSPFLLGGNYKLTNNDTSLSWEFKDGHEHGLMHYGWTVYNDKTGKWAEIIKDQTIKICGEAVVIDKKSGYISIKGIYYNFVEINSLYNILLSGQVQSLNVGCNGQETIKIDIIEKILKQLR